MRSLGSLVVGGLCLLFVPNPATAASIVPYISLTSWESAVGGAAPMQDFEGFAAGADLDGVSVLPGISVTTNAEDLVANSSGGNIAMFLTGGDTRVNSNAFYQIDFAFGYNAFALDIVSFETGSGPSVANPSTPLLMDILLEDGSTHNGEVYNGSSTSPLFLGMVASSPFVRITIYEPLENGGGNEEVALDNFRVAAPVPEPSTMLLLGSGLVGLAGYGRRPRKD